MSPVPSPGSLLHTHHLWRKKSGSWRVVLLQVCRDRHETSSTPPLPCPVLQWVTKERLQRVLPLSIWFIDLWECQGSVTFLLREKLTYTYMFYHIFFPSVNTRSAPLPWNLKQWFLTLVMSQNPSQGLLEMQIPVHLLPPHLQNHRPLTTCVCF